MRTNTVVLRFGSTLLGTLVLLGCAPATKFSSSKNPMPPANEYDRNDAPPQGVPRSQELPPQGVNTPPVTTTMVSPPILPNTSGPSAADLLIAAAQIGIENLLNGSQSQPPVVQPQPQPQPEPYYPQPVVPVATPTPAPKPNPLKLTVVQTKYEAWWKDCLSVAVYDINGTLLSSAAVSCNKDTNTIGKTVALAAAPYPACNVIRLYVSTYKNEGSTCSQHRGEPGYVCNGPYPSSPSWTRSNLAGRDFYRVYDARYMSQRDPRILYQENWTAIQDTARRNRGDGRNRMMMGFYEDQPNLDGAGVDFNDFVFNLVGENVRFTVEQGDRASNERSCNEQ
jgi:hypothetical protein